MTIEFKYQSLFTCSVPTGYTIIKDFNELIASDNAPTAGALSDVLTASFEASGVKVNAFEFSKDLNHCDVVLEGDETPIRVIIRTRPSLVIDGNIYKLDEFDI